jgi:indolepyruvate ferredoxin oxidoreductase alpha subunit
MILDNETTGMTGGQKSSALGRLEQICLGLGVEKEHLHVINPVKKEHEANVELIKKELAYEGVSVIIPRRECLVTLTKSKRAAKKSK